MAPAPSFDASIGSSTQASSTGAYEDCNSTYYYYDETTASAWTSGNTSAFTMSPTTSGLAYAVAAGSSTISAAYTGELWYYYSPQARCLYHSIPSSNGTEGVVPTPYQAAVSGNVVQGAATCPSGQAGWSRTVYLQLQDQTGSGIDIAGITMADSIHLGSRNDLGASDTTTGSHVTDNNGAWPDTYFVCSPACPGSGESDALQTWTYNTVPLPSANLVVYKCNSITVNGK